MTTLSKTIDCWWSAMSSVRHHNEHITATMNDLWHSSLFSLITLISTQSLQSSSPPMTASGCHALAIEFHTIPSRLSSSSSTSPSLPAYSFSLSPSRPTPRSVLARLAPLRPLGDDPDPTPPRTPSMSSSASARSIATPDDAADRF